MAFAFIEMLVGEFMATVIKGVIEFTNKEADDDVFAAFHRLV